MKKLLDYKRILSFILVFTLMLSNISVSAVALEKDLLSSSSSSLEESKIDTGISQAYREDVVKSISEEQLKTVSPGEKTLAELSKMTVDVESLPIFIDSTTALQKGHVNRVEEQENNLNTVVYQNKDGSKTTYIFKNPVKYIDDEGNIRDKSNLINTFESKDYKYAVTDNIVKTYFPNQSTVGTKIDFHHFSIITTPISKNAALPTKVNDNTIKYEGVFGDNTSVVYYTELNGIKEDIVLSKSIGQNEFRFDLSVSNLIPFESNGIWYLKDSEQKIVASFGKIIVSDAEGKTIEGTMNIAPTTQKGKYVITIVVPIEFLNAKSTVYPVRIDPSTYIVETGSYYYIGESGYEECLFYNAIEDTGLYSTQSGADNALNNLYYHRLGRYNSVDGKIIYKLYDFFGEYGQYKNLRPSQIGSVQLCIEVDSGSSATLSVNQMLSTWDESDVDTDTVAIYDSNLWNLYSIDNESTFNLPSAAGRYSIDITEIVKGWARFNSNEVDDAHHNPELGFVLSSNFTSSSRNVTAVEDPYSANSVYITMDTTYIGGDYYVNNIVSGQFLRKNDEIALTTSLYADTTDIQWQFEYIGNDNYYIRSSSTNDALYAFENTLSLASLPAEDPPNYYIWEVKNAVGGGVTIKNVGNGYVIRYDGTALSLTAPIASGNTAYKQTVWGVVAKDSYVNLTDFEISDDWLLPNSNKYFYVEADATWSSNSNFTWSIVSNGKVGKNIFDVDQDGQIYASQAGGKATLTLTHKMTGLSKSFTIKSGELRDGVYMIMNTGISAYIAVDSNSDATIPRLDYNTADQAKWKIQVSASGFYLIKSVYSEKWLKAGSNTDPNAIVQYTSSVTQSAKWYITKTSSGNYKITPLSDESVVISMLSNASAFALASYSANNYYMCEWVFDNVGETHGIKNGDIYTIISTNSENAITAENGGEENGTNICQYAFTPGYQWQRWKIIYIGNGEYKIQNMNSGTFLRISGDSMFNNANLQLWTDVGATGQTFRIIENIDGTYSFLTKCSYYTSALTVDDGSTDNNVCQRSNTGSDNQKFSVKKHNVTMDYLSPCIEDLYSYAIEFAPNGNKSYRQQLVLQYIRHNHSSYTGNMWPMVAGDINGDFTEYVNSKDPFLNKIFDGKTGSYPETPGYSAASYVMDYNGEYIDFYHMCATLNAMLYSDYYCLDFISDSIKNLAGWAADLITTVPNAFERLETLGLSADYTNLYDAMYYIMSSGGSGTNFPRADYLADIDAVVLYSSINNIVMESFDDYFEYHYQYNCRVRFTTITTMLTYEESIAIIDCYLSYTPIVTLMLDEEGEIIFLSQEQHNAIRDAFVDYFWECLENEQM